MTLRRPHSERGGHTRATASDWNRGFHLLSCPRDAPRDASDPNELEQRLAALEEFRDTIPQAPTLATIRAIVVTLRRQAREAASRGADTELVEQIEQACDEIAAGLHKLKALTLRDDVNEMLVRLAAKEQENPSGQG
jgi:hypothetical protein